MDFEKLKKLQGFITHDEGVQLYYLAMSVSYSHSIVEIGSYKGQSTCYLASGSKAGNGVPVYAIDLWQYGDDQRYNAPVVKKTFEDQVVYMNLNNIVVPVEGDSLTVAKSWRLPIGLLFIDGCHDYEAVKADFEAWSPFVVSGGLIALHDYKNSKYPLIEGVDQFVDEDLKKNPQYADYGITDSLYCVRKG